MSNNKTIIYPTAQEIIEFNVLALDTIKTKKADKSEVLNFLKVQQIITRCIETEGNIYDKAASMLKNTIKTTCFCKRKQTNFIYYYQIFFTE